jgi:hypothetical protein
MFGSYLGSVVERAPSTTEQSQFATRALEPPKSKTMLPQLQTLTTDGTYFTVGIFPTVLPFRAVAPHRHRSC